MLHNSFLAFCLLAVLVEFASTEETDPLPYDYPDRAHETAVCEALQMSESEMKLNLNQAFTYEDALKLMSWNLKYDFGNAKRKPTYGADVESFKKGIIEALFTGFRNSCPDEFVSHRFLNIMEQFNLIYQNSISSTALNVAEWGKIPQRLNECANKTVHPGYFGRGPLIERISVMMYDNSVGSLNIYPPMEDADMNYPQMDLIIETLWWAFAHTYGNCYNYVTPDWAEKLKELFEKDFIKPITKRWMDVGPGVDYGIMTGDFQVDKIMINMRYCVTGTYIVRTILDKQIVRPLEVEDPSGDLVQNSRTGTSMM